MIRNALLAIALLLAFSTAATAQLGQSELEERLTCQCGCGLTVHTCNHLQCSFGIPAKEDIAASLAKGEEPQSILDRYVEEYGEQVLSSPTTTGFNLLAWTGPYIAITLAGFILIGALRRLARTRTAAAASEGEELAPTLQATPEERARLTKELEDFDQ